MSSMLCDIIDAHRAHYSVFYFLLFTILVQILKCIQLILYCYYYSINSSTMQLLKHAMTIVHEVTAARESFLAEKQQQ